MKNGPAYSHEEKIAIIREHEEGHKTLKQVCEKYGISICTLSRRAKKEGWPEMRKINDDKITAKALEAYNEKEIQKRLDLIEAADVLLERVGLVFTLNPELDVRDIRGLAAALKDIKDVKNVEADIREQEAKIKNLEKTANEESATVSVEFKMPEGTESYAE